MSFQTTFKNGGIAGGVHAGSPVQGVDGKSRILSQDHISWSEMAVVLGLDSGVLFKSFAVLNGWGQLVHFRQRFQRQTKRLGGFLKLTQFARIGSCNVDSGMHKHLLIMI